MSASDDQTGLTPDQKAVWAMAEAADGAAAKAWLDSHPGAGPAAMLLACLAMQNASMPDAVLPVCEPARPGWPSAFETWRRAEFQIAARRESALNLPEDQKLRAPDAVRPEDAAAPLAALIEGRAALALGYERLHEGDYLAAENFFSQAVNSMRDAGMSSALAAALTEMGKVNSWQGRMQSALTYLLEALSIWQTNETAAAATWHEIGALLLDMGRSDLAAGLLQRTFALNQSQRTRHAWVRALIAERKWDEAERVAGTGLENEIQLLNAPAADAQGAHSAYRQVMFTKELGVIAAARALDSSAETAEQAGEVRKAERHLDAAVKALHMPVERGEPLFTQWIGALDQRMKGDGESRRDSAPEVRFEQLKLVELELMIAATHAPQQAAVGFDKLAEVFATGGERALEIDAREAAASAHLRSGEALKAIRQIHYGLRVATERGLQDRAIALRTKLASMIGQTRYAGLQVEGYLPTELVRSHEGTSWSGGLDIKDGRRVMIQKGALGGKTAQDRIEALGTLWRAKRVHAGVPVVLAVEHGKDTTVSLVTEFIEGEPLLAVMRADAGNLQRAVGMVRDIGEALDVLHRAGLKRCEPEAGDVIVELGDNPVFVNLIGAQPAEGGVPDTVWLARLLIDWLTAGRGAPPQRPWDILRGRVPYNPLAGAKVEGKMPEGLIRLLKAVLRNREGAPKTPGAFASRLQAFA